MNKVCDLREPISELYHLPGFETSITSINKI